MQIVRTVIWVLVLAALLAFSAVNWEPVEVTIWSDLVVETKIPALVIVAFLLGLLPMWLVHRETKWRLERRIAALESSLHSNAVATGNAATAAAHDSEAVPEPVQDRPHTTGSTEAQPQAAVTPQPHDRYTPEAPNARTSPGSTSTTDERTDRE